MSWSYPEVLSKSLFEVELSLRESSVRGPEARSESDWLVPSETELPTALSEASVLTVELPLKPLPRLLVASEPESPLDGSPETEETSLVTWLEMPELSLPGSLVTVEPESPLPVSELESSSLAAELADPLLGSELAGSLLAGAELLVPLLAGSESLLNEPELTASLLSGPELVIASLLSAPDDEAALLTPELLASLSAVLSPVEADTLSPELSPELPSPLSPCELTAELLAALL